MMTLKMRDENLINNWYVACLSKKLNKKKIIKSDIYDESMVIFRDKSGNAVALADRCLHRHAQLSKGRLCGGQIECPYHGWTYDHEGRVTHIPSEGYESQGRAHYRVRSYPVVEQDECVWVWTGKEPPITSAPPFRFPYFNVNGWRHYFMETWFDNEVTHLVENFMDVPHTVLVHAGWFRNRSMKCVPITVDSGDQKVLVTYRQTADSIGFSGRFLNPTNKPLFHTDLFIMPNITRVDYSFGERGFTIISQCTPVSTLKTKVYTAIIFKMGLLNVPLDPFFRFYTRQVINQDVEIMQNQGENFARDFSCNFKSTDADVVHSAIEKLRNEGRSSTSQREDSSQLTVDKEIWI